MEKQLQDSHIEECSPNPEFLIKSISEQGYSLETALADLIDNSITAAADRIEIMLDVEKSPFTLFIADNGVGMSEKQLSSNMRFPSNSPEQMRQSDDLGRFGLGLKTASFSQTRRFTVLTRKKGENEYKGRTWDVDYLRQTKQWHIIKNSDNEIQQLVDHYRFLSQAYLNPFENFEPNTIVIWQGLYKFEKYLSKDKQKESLKKELSETTSDYLSLVFHRFLEDTDNPLKIRINNTQISPFNPFPSEISDVRIIPPRQAVFKDEHIRLEGFVLPVRSLDESKKQNSIWTTEHLSMLDLEGIYIYRSDRIILFGGWNGIIRKSPNLQLARLKVDVGNKIDHLLHLNVAKSQIKVPYEVKNGFFRYISELKEEAQREYFNRGIRKFSDKQDRKQVDLFVKSATNKGAVLELNHEFPLIKNVFDHLPVNQRSSLKVLIRLINTYINGLRKVHYEDSFTIGDNRGDSPEAIDLVTTVEELLKAGMSKAVICSDLLPSLGYRKESLPKQVLDRLT